MSCSVTYPPQCSRVVSGRHGVQECNRRVPLMLYTAWESTRCRLLQMSRCSVSFCQQQIP